MIMGGRVTCGKGLKVMDDFLVQNMFEDFWGFPVKKHEKQGLYLNLLGYFGGKKPVQRICWVHNRLGKQTWKFFQ